MATIVIKRDYSGNAVALLYRNGFIKEEVKSYDGVTYTKIVPKQREGYMRQITDYGHFNFRKKPIDDYDLKYLWEHRTTPEELFSFFKCTFNPNSDVEYVFDNVDPWICFCVDGEVVLYFGKDEPKLTTKTTKIATKHSKMWGVHNLYYILKENRKPFEYQYWEVKDKSKLLFCSSNYIERIFPEIDWNKYYPTAPQYRINIKPFKASDEYDYTQEEKTAIIKRQQEDEEKEVERLEELERLKQTPGHCSMCGSEHASYVLAPYQYDMYGIREHVWLCDSCYGDLCGDI